MSQDANLQIMVLAVFIILTVGGGLVIGFLTMPGEWYVKLTKPFEATIKAGVFRDGY